MLRHHVIIRLSLPLLCVVMVQGAPAADVLENAPQDALAVLYFRDLESLEAPLHAIYEASPLQINLAATPLTMLHAVVGRNAGLDEHGDGLLVLLSNDDPTTRRPLCAMLPVTDYGRFVRALNGNPNDRITVVTVFGEDVLCAHHDKWALLLDADQRERLSAMLAGKSDPPSQLLIWRSWLRAQNLAAVAFPTGASSRALREWISPAPDAKQPSIAAWLRGEGASQTEDDATAIVSGHIRTLLTHSPKLAEFVLQARAAAIGVRLDASGNASAGVRVAWPPANEGQGTASGNSREPEFALQPTSPPSLHRDRRFVFSGNGRLPRSLLLVAAETYANNTINEWKRANARTNFDAESIDGFRHACEQLAGDVRAFAAFHALGDERDGVFTNQFLSLRVASADECVTRIADVVRRWNELNSGAEPTTGMVFDSQRVQIAGRSATQYSLDIVAADGLREIPEIRQLMERLFGPDRKMRLLVIPVDEQTVLLAMATPAQAVATLSAAASPTWNAANVVVPNQLLPSQAAWRLFVNLEGYTTVRKRETDATLGDAIGANKPRLFPAAPPVGLAGGFSDRELWIDVAMPAETARAVGRFMATQ